MPTTYAHWRFGDVAMKKLPEDLREIIDRYRWGVFWVCT